MAGSLGVSALLIFTIVVWVLGLALRGSLPFSTAGVVLIALVVLAGIGRAIGSSLVGGVFRIGLPLASLLIYAAVFGQQQFASILSLSLVVFIVLFGLYLMIGGVRRR